MTRTWWIVPALLAAVTLAACGDPVHDRQREALGEEVDGVPRGPLHRPGQPCLVCHGDYGPAHMVLSLAGTIYQSEDAQNVTPTPLKDALVTLKDAAGDEYQVMSNCAGNFYVQRADYDPIFPVGVTVTYGPTTKDSAGNCVALPGGLCAPMLSKIHRDGSCASCHSDPMGPNSSGHVYMTANPFDFPPAGCP
jgi:hypothetical protein